MPKINVFSLVAPVLLLLTGCGGGGSGSGPAGPAADFSLQAAPATVNLSNGGPPASLTINATALNGFTGSVSVAIAGLPAGVTASPATVSLTPGVLTQVALTASGAVVGTPASLTLTGTSGTLTHTASASLSVAKGTTTAALSNSSFDFGADLVGNTITQSVVTVTNTGTIDLPISPTITGDASYSLAATQACGNSVAAGTSCAVTVNYKPAAASGATPQAATLNLGLSDVPATTLQTVSLTGTSAALAAGVVTTTNNPQVAQYSMTLPFPGSITVNFGTDTKYGRSTWSQSTPVAGGQINMLVAGMLGKTLYHLQATVQFDNGITATDADHTFTTGATPYTLPITATTTAGLTPQPGVEQLTMLETAPAGAAQPGVVVTDLQANVLWTYVMPFSKGGSQIEGAKLLPNGHYLLAIGQGSGFPLAPGVTPPNTVIAVREVDLAGNLVKEITIQDLNNELTAAGYNLNLLQFHHEIEPLPNGHWLVLANILKPYTNLTGYPGTTNVLGDVIVDLDTNLRPVWVWSEFDHLDVNRHPYQFPDWTHTNAIVYSPDDGNIFVSTRHQNWVLKVDYQDGAGTGNIIWRLGYQGDFKLVGGTDPTDWQYAQHFPHLFSANSTGIFSLGLMDNGDDRISATGVTCGNPGAPACYSTIPVFQIDESAMTATLTFHQILPTALYSNFGGNAEPLTNGNVEYDLAGGVPASSNIYEVTPTSTPQTVWHMKTSTINAYRGYRLPSLYPGVQW